MDSIIEKEEADEREKVRQEVCACVKITVAGTHEKFALETYVTNLCYI